MVVASFLQKHTQYVSLLTGGYIAIHNYFSENINGFLQDHHPKSCILCASHHQQTPPATVKSGQSSSDLFGKISAAMKSKSAEVTGKLMDYIVNPNNSSPVQERHVSSTDKIGKRYRNVAPVFSIDDDHDNVTNEEVSVQNHSKRKMLMWKIVCHCQLVARQRVLNRSSKHVL